MKQFNEAETKAINDAFSFVAMTCNDFKPEHFEHAMLQLKKHYEVLRDFTNNEIAKHFKDLVEMTIGNKLIENDFKGIEG